MGLLRGRYRGAVTRFDWNAGIFGVRSAVNLMSRRHHERQSNLLARTISEHVQAHHSPVSLLAQSGGCFIVLRALEKLPAEIRVHTAVLLAPSVSPGYDLSTATRKCTNKLVSFGSLGDAIFLGLATLLLGTSDRVFSPSAGFVGWHANLPGFIECRWHPLWLRYGYWGNHISTSSPRFIADVVTPMLAN
jgi:pimeloyl-ACP methyl ester carboxylesterase